MVSEFAGSLNLKKEGKVKKERMNARRNGGGGSSVVVVIEPLSCGPIYIVSLFLAWENLPSSSHRGAPLYRVQIKQITEFHVVKK